MNDDEFREVIARDTREMKRALKHLAEQLGGLGNKFGSYTEGLKVPSLKKILEDKFQAEVLMPRVKVRRGGKTMELDLLAYSNGAKNQAHLVEIKSHLDEEGLAQIKKQLADFPKFFPEHREKELYGLLAAVDFTDAMAKKVIKEGIFLAHVHNEVFRLQVPAGFRPKSFRV
jgi:hypothetical protein